MTDEELIARLRKGPSMLAQEEAADRIEALVKQAVMDRAVYEGVSSMLLSLQEDCIKERNRAERLEAALRFYSCEDGCNDCPANERDRIGCGWTARAALIQKDRTDWRSVTTKTEDGYNG